MILRFAAVALVAAAACAGQPGPDGTGPDAPYDLADESDLESRRQELDAIDLGDPALVPARRRLADEYARRITADLDAGARASARRGLATLLSMWRPRELADPSAARALGRHRAVLARARAAFARTGDDLGAVTALAALAWVEPSAAHHLGELDEVLRYDDALTRALGAGGSRPIEILTELAEAFPTRPVVDRLVALLRVRRRALDRPGPGRPSTPRDLIAAHGEAVARTAFTIAATLAWADRLDDVAAATASITGLGDDRELRRRLAAATSPRADAAAFEQLAAWFAGDDGRAGDPRATLAVAQAGLARTRDPALALRAAQAAAELDRPLLAIRDYERALGRGLGPDGAADALAQLYLERINDLGQADRAGAAYAVLVELERLAERATQVNQTISPDVADGLAIYGRALVSLGQLAEGQRSLERSVAMRPNQIALDVLGTVLLKRGDPTQAVRRFEQAMKLPAEGPADRYERAKLYLRLGEAFDAAAQHDRAVETLEAGLAEWNQLVEDLEMPPANTAEALVERGKLLWRLRALPTARAAFARAVDAERGEGSILSDVVGFLVLEGDLATALDVYLTGLAGRGVPETIKVYMSLWIVAEARRRNQPVPRLALEHLGRRHGHLWADDLARLATGRATYDGLRPRATTRARRAELSYYAAVLGDVRQDRRRARALLEQVLASDMVLFFEFDMAKRWLERAGAAHPLEGV